MTITATGLTKAAAVAAAVAGAIFIAVQINHPPMEVASAETSEWVVRSTAKVVMGALALAGITGMYLRQHRQAGVLGLVGYLLFTVGYLAMFGVEVIAATVLPALTGTDPGYVRDVLVAAAGGTPIGDIGGMQTVLNVMRPRLHRGRPPVRHRPVPHPASWPAGRRLFSRSAPSPPPRSPCCRRRSTGRWPSPSVSP